MNKKLLAMTVTFISSAIMVLFLFYLLGKGTPVVFVSAQALSQTIPTIAVIEPPFAPNDLDTIVNITGTGFTAGFSETVVITQPVVWLGDLQLSDATWVSTTLLTATVPWGIDPGVYTLTVVNSDNGTASLPEAFTVTQGINTWATGGPYGGGIYNFALGESGYQTVYAMVNNVGLFRSRTSGDSWELVINETGWESFVTVDPTNPNRIFVPKGRKGLYRSEDGGDTWTLLPLPIPDIPLYRIRAFVNPQDGTLFGALSSLGCGGGCGLFKFSEAGQTWQLLQTTGVLTGGTGVTSVGFDPVNSQIMYAGTRDGVVVKSVDGGQVWTSLGQTPTQYVARLFVNPIGNHEPWVCGTGDSDGGGLYKYSGGNWTLVYAPNVSDLVFDPAATDATHQTIWIASISGVMQSQDGGQSWNSISPFSYVSAITLNPANPQIIYANYFSEGVIATHDGGASWQWHNQGLSGLVPGNMAVNPDDPKIVYAAVGASGIYGSRNGGGAWERLTESTGGPLVVDPANPQHVVSADFGRVIIADDGWHFNRRVAIPLPSGMSDQYYTPSILALAARPNSWLMGVGYWDRGLPYMNYAGGGGIYTSQDGESWTATELTQIPYAVSDLDFDPIDPRVLFAATSGDASGTGSNFYKSVDGGQSWLPSVTGISPEEKSDGAVIAVEPTSPYRIFLATGSSLYVSADKGANWSRANSPLASNPNEPITSLLYVQAQPSVLYAASTIGLFRSVDGAQTWQRAQGTLGQLEIWSMAGAVTSDRLVFYAATIGGMTNGSQAQAMHLASSNETLVSAGVYRYTTHLLTQHIYLPLVFRVY